MKVKLKHKPSRAVELFRRIPLSGETPELTCMAGNPDARCLVITPPFTAEEHVRAAPLSHEAGHRFFQFLSGNSYGAGMLFVSCTRFGFKSPKMKKAQFAPIVEYLSWVVSEKLFNKFICIGGTAFKGIFGAGKMPSAETLYGSTIYHPLTGYKPLFTFPEIELLSISSTGNRRADFINSKKSEEVKREFEILMDGKFPAFWELP